MDRLCLDAVERWKTGHSVIYISQYTVVLKVVQFLGRSFVTLTQADRSRGTCITA